MWPSQSSMTGEHQEWRIEGWLRVYEGHVPQHARPSDSDHRPEVRWHYGFCVARTDEQSLICYRSEQCVPRDRGLLRLRLDGGSLNIWKDLKFSTEFIRRRPFHAHNLSSSTAILIEEDETEEESSKFCYATLRTPKAHQARHHNREAQLLFVRLTSRSLNSLSPKRPMNSKSLRPSRRSRPRGSATVALVLPPQLVCPEPQPTLDRRVLTRKSRSRSLMQRVTRRISNFSRYKSQEDLEMNSAASTTSYDVSDKVAQGYTVRVSSQGGRSVLSRSCDHLENVSLDEATSSSSGYRTATENPHAKGRKSGGVERRLKKTANFLFGSGWNVASSASTSGWLLSLLYAKS